MLDQSFSALNFRKVLDYENRKGLYLEGNFFPDVVKLSEKIKAYNKYIKKSNLPKDQFSAICERRDRLKDQKEEMLMIALTKISDAVVSSTFKISLEIVNTTDKQIYTVGNAPEAYFALKKLQYNFSKVYNVKQANRFAILSQVIEYLKDDFPKYIVRTDLSDFYESIPHEALLKKLNQENLLTSFSKKIIWQVLRDFENKTGGKLGVPRGIGISAYLSELYMRDIDSEIKALPHCIYYARYVDDIIAIFTPEVKRKTRNYLDEIQSIIESPKYALKLNLGKTKPYNLLQHNSRGCEMNFLGYDIHFGKHGEAPELSLTTKKLKKYEEKIRLTLLSYNKDAKVDKRKARRLLLDRIRFLTGNTRLSNNKSNVLIGIYYSHNLLTNIAGLKILDQSLSTLLMQYINCAILRDRIINQFSFETGFLTRRYSSFPSHRLFEILKIWKKIN